MNTGNRTAPERGRLIVISGFSGVGKGTVIRRLMEKHPGAYTFSVSATTRAPREGEVNGREYFFISREEFELWVQEDRFLEHATYVSNSYGTPRFFVEEQLKKGVSVILDIEVNGALQVRESDPEARLFYMIPPDAESLRNRILGRGTESGEQVRNRLQKALAEAPLVHEYDAIVVNDDVEAAADELQGLIDGSGEPRRSHGSAVALTGDIAQGLAKILKEL